MVLLITSMPQSIDYLIARLALDPLIDRLACSVPPHTTQRDAAHHLDTLSGWLSSHAIKDP